MALCATTIYNLAVESLPETELQQLVAMLDAHRLPVKKAKRKSAVWNTAQCRAIILPMLLKRPKQVLQTQL